MEETVDAQGDVTGSAIDGSLTFEEFVALRGPGLVRLARVVRARPGLAFLLAGALLSVAGNMLSSGPVFIAGSLVFLRGAAVLLGVSEPRRPGGPPAGRADFFGFGTPPRGRGESGRG